MKFTGKKLVASFLAVILIAGTFAVMPVRNAFAVSNDKVLASTTEIAKNSTVVLKKGAIDNKDGKEISGFFRTLFEFNVEAVKEDGTYDIKTEVTGDFIQKSGITADTAMDLFKIDKSNTAARVGFTLAFAVLSTFSWPVEYNVNREWLSLVEGGINSTPDELKYVGKEATIKAEALDADGNEVSSFWKGFTYDITSVIDTVAHLRCRLTPSKLEDMGISQEQFAGMIGVPSDNVYYSAAYKVIMALGYTVHFDFKLEDLNISGVVEPTSDLDTESETDSTPQTVIKPVVVRSILAADPTLDGDIQMADVVLIQKHIADLTTIAGDAFLAADVTGDGTLNMKDVTTIQKFIAELVTTFPVGRKIDITSDTEVPVNP